MILESVHLRGASGHVRLEDYDGREHLVLPVVALIGNQIIHAVNSPQPERISIETLEKAAATFDQKPVVLGHPVRNGKQVTANSPEVLASHGIGTIRNPRMSGPRLLMDVYVDPVKAERLGGPDFVRDLRASTPCDVSVGAFVTCDTTPGELYGKKYGASWLETLGDHLAVLWPNGKGACDWSSGCGIRAAMHLVTAEGFELKVAARPESLDERMAAVQNAVQRAYGGSSQGLYTQPVGSAYAQQVYDDHVIVQKDDKLYSVNYTTSSEGEVTFVGTPTEVEQEYVMASARMEDCPACTGSGNVGGNPCEACEGKGEMRAAVGARNSAADKSIIQRMHDHAVSLGADCTPSNYKMAAQAVEPTLRAACGCKGASQMTPEQKTAAVRALAAHPHSGFTEADEAVLATFADDRIITLQAAADVRASAAAALKTAEDARAAAEGKSRDLEGQLRAAQAPRVLTEAEFMEAAPPALKSAIARQIETETVRKADLVTSLKTAQAEYTETELTAMDLTALERLARVAKTEVAAPVVDYSGRGVARVAQSADVYAPPNPYENDLKALRAAVN